MPENRVVAVSISAYEAGLQRDWQRAAVWPYIQLNRSFYCKESSVAPGGCEWTLTLNAENVGVGPAHVRDFHVAVDGKPQATWRAAMQALLRTNDDVRYGQSNSRETHAEKIDRCTTDGNSFTE